MAEERPLIGVIVPAYGHPRFLGEAVESAMAQDIHADIQLVIIDDGCRYEATREVSQALMQQFPKRVSYVRQRNARLPAARNRGIEFLLARYPKLDSVYFLDADNRLAPHSLRRFHETLRNKDSQPGSQSLHGHDAATGWAYPDIGFFGLSPDQYGVDVRETAPEYSRLLHLAGNISEAGSLVCGDMLRAGVRFDEDLRAGFEDWDFWLRGQAAGFAGRRCLDSGFSYRRRPESMLADARRQNDQIVAQMRASHPSLFNRDYVLALRQSEAPAFAVITMDADGSSRDVQLFLDPCGPVKTITFTEWQSQLKYHQLNPLEQAMPDRVVFIADKLWQSLGQQTRLLRDLFFHLWQIETSAMVSIGADADAIAFVTNGRDFAAGKPLSPPFALRNFSHPDCGKAVEPAPTARPQLREFVLKCEDKVRETRDVIRHQSRRYSGPDANGFVDQLMEDVCQIIDPIFAFPKLMDDRSVLLIIQDRHLRDEAQLGELRTQLEALTERGLRPSLLVELLDQANVDHMDATVASLVDDIIMLPLSQSVTGNSLYLGHDLPLWLSEANMLRAERIVASYAHVTVIGDCALVEVLGAARRWGRQTAVIMNGQAPISNEVQVHDASHDDIARMLAYEHAVNFMVVDDKWQSSSLSANGVPEGKICSWNKYLNAIQPKPQQKWNPGGALPKGWRPEKGFVFIVTYGRSGSTLLQNLVDDTPGTFMRGENMGLMEELAKTVMRVEEIPWLVDLRAETGPTNPWYGAENIYARSIMQDLVDMFIRQVLKPDPKAKRIGFKEIRYTGFAPRRFDYLMDFMLRAFAPAKIIFNIRDHNNVVKSAWWREMEADTVKKMLRGADRKFKRYAEEHPRDCLLIDYDKLKGNPEEVRRLYEFLDAPFDEERVTAILERRLTH